MEQWYYFILYAMWVKILLCYFYRSPPFLGKNTNETIDKIINKPLQFSQPSWKNRSNFVKMFIKELLNKDPSKRPSAKESLNLGWIELN